MKLRTQLILAFLLLAVVPLSAITLYAYQSSARALRRTVAAESARAAEEMERRMGVVTANLSRRIDRLEEIPFPAAARGLSSPLEGSDAQVIGRLLTTLGDAASFIDAFEFHAAPGAHAPPAPGTTAGRPARAPRKPKTPSAPAAAGAPGTTSPIILHLPRIAGELAKDPDVAPLLKAAVALIPADEAGKLEKEMIARLGRHGETIARLVREGIEAAQSSKEPEAEGAPRRDAGLRLKKEFGCELRRDGERVGSLKARVSSDRLLGQILSQSRRDQGEIPFARDAAGNLFTPDPKDLTRLKELHLAPDSGAGGGSAPEGGAKDEQWVVVTHEDPATGLTFGLARPVGESLEEIRRASGRNLLAGLGLAAIALFGVLPLSRRMTQNLSDLTRGAERLAAGHLDTQVPVRSRDELGQLTLVFNRMATEIRAGQERLVEQERLRKELELCRRIQVELLPRKPLYYPFAEVQGLSLPAHELGGDFFNYFGLPGGEIALIMGDVSGKGVPAALLMANLQATLQARIPLEPDLAAFAERLDREGEASTPAEVYLTLFLGILDPKRRELRYVNAGHESPFLLRQDGRPVRLDSTGRPIGLLAGGGYSERRIALGAGDRLFMYTDGLVDAENEAGADFGAARLEALLSGEGAGDAAGARTPQALLAKVERAFAEHRGRIDAADDATLLVLRVGDWAGAGAPAGAAALA